MPLSDPRAAGIDLVLVRENTEGLFYARGRSQQEGDDAVVDPMRISRAGTTRICDFAFRLAERRKSQGRPGHVTTVDKANVFHSMAFWSQIFEKRAKQFTGYEAFRAFLKPHTPKR